MRFGLGLCPWCVGALRKDFLHKCGPPAVPAHHTQKFPPVQTPAGPPLETRPSLRCSRERAKKRPKWRRGRPRRPKVSHRPPKWSQNGGPEHTGDGLGCASGHKRQNIKSVSYLLHFSHIGHPGNSPFSTPRASKIPEKNNLTFTFDNSIEKRAENGGKIAIVGSPGHPKSD